jgi:hypothetical protein
MASHVLASLDQAGENLRWLEEKLPSLFTGTLREDGDAIAALVAGLGRLRTDRQLVLADRAHELILARLDVPGSIFETLRQLEDRDLSRAEISHSRVAVPGCDSALELQRYVFDRKPDALVRQAGAPSIPERVRRDVLSALAALDPALGIEVQEEVLRTLWLNDPRYVEAAPPQEVARMLRLLHQARSHAGFFLGVEPPDDAQGVLQDIHWSAGMIGYFPTYQLGNIISCQIWEKVLEAMPDLYAQFERGEFIALREWLRENLHRHGRKFTPKETLAKVVGGPISVGPYVRYLKAKLGEIYGLS